MQNRLIKLLGILLVFFIYSCYCHRSSSTTDCTSFLKSKNLSFDVSKDLDKYVEDITNQISTLKQNDMKKTYHNCTKPEIMKHYFKMHPLIDSVTITPSGHGISFLRRDKNVWSNIIID